MPMDRFSPVAPAHIRVLVLPVGNIDRKRYLNILARLQKEAWIVNLADIERYVTDNDLLLSPKAFPKGSILYSYSTSLPNPQQEHLSPFELFREPLLVLGVVDKQGGQDGADEEELEPASIYLRERHPRVVHRQLLILEKGYRTSRVLYDDAIRIPYAATPGDEDLKKAVCQISARFLKELSTYTRAMQASPSVQTPGQTARSLQRTASQRENDKRPSSGHSTPTKNAEPTTPVESSGGVRLPLSNLGSPATSFDQIASANNNDRSEASRPDSRTSNRSKHTRRASSQDRVSVQGFGSGTSQDKLKQRGKARVGIVIGSLYMTAGQWSEGLRILVEHTNKARALSDHIWHAKGLENIVACLLLHSWAGLEFQIPSICYTLTQQRSSINLTSDTKPADAAQLASIRRLSTSLPDLLKLVLSLYRSIEGSLELPFLCIAEATIRFSKLLAALHNAGGELDHSTLDQFIGSSTKSDDTSSQTKSLPRGGGPSKATIGEMLSHAYPTNESTVQVSDQMAIMAGTASVYAVLQMHRKKAQALRALVAKLTTALTQARKRGAAEVGIHPAASLSGETAADAILALTQDSKGVYKMMAEIARVYGIALPVQFDDAGTWAQSQPGFGSDTLKVSILRDLTAFCEATPDPYGVLLMTTAVLAVFGPNGAVDVEAYRSNGVLKKEDQLRLTETLARIIGVSQLIGLPPIQATCMYWDRFLVRGVEFVPPSPGLKIIDCSSDQSKPGVSTTGATAGSVNPLLYDPNAKPGTGPKAQDTLILVAKESSVCLVTLQNPYETPVEVESLKLGTDGIELRTSHAPFTLRPMRLQQVAISVLPATPGDYKIDHIIVKISGSAEQKFPIVSEAWIPVASMLVKDIGQEAKVSEAPLDASGLGPGHTVIEVKVIEPQPLLVIEDRILQNTSMMLLDGEERRLDVAVRNTCDLPLTIFKQTTGYMNGPAPDADLNTSLLLVHDVDEVEWGVEVKAGATRKFKLGLPGKGKASITRMQSSFFYCLQQGDRPQYARRLDLNLHLTINAALQAQHLRALPLEGGANTDDFMLSFDLRNAWPDTLRYRVVPSPMTDDSRDNVQAEESEFPLTNADGQLKPGQVERVDILMPRLVLHTPAEWNAGKRTIALLERLSVTWRGEDRAGEVDLSGLALGPEDVDIVAQSSLRLKMQLLSPNQQPRPDSASGDVIVKVGSLATLVVKLSAPPGITEALVVQMRPSSVNSKDGDRPAGQVLAETGWVERFVHPSGYGGEDMVHFPVCPVAAGRVELEVMARAVMGMMNMGGGPGLGVARRRMRLMAVE